jgi:hypothetical protein
MTMLSSHSYIRVIALFVVGFACLQGQSLLAQDASTLPVSVHVGVRTSFAHTDPQFTASSDRFLLDSARLFVSGNATKQIKLTLNTEYTGADNRIQVMDAIGQIEFSPKANIWMGRFLPPSDRANLNGPYFANHWGVYSDGVQDGFPGIFQGRANGVAYWGNFEKLGVSVGAFDGPTLTGENKVLAASRIQYDFWDAEPGYYMNGTYYGQKNILAIGVAGQAQGRRRSATSVDFLMERKVGAGGAFTVEGELAKYHLLGGYDARYANDQGGYVLASYLFPVESGPGRFQILGKYGKANFTKAFSAANPSYHQKTTEININYIIKEFDARVMVFFMDNRYNAVQQDSKRIGVGLQIQK